MAAILNILNFQEFFRQAGDKDKDAFISPKEFVSHINVLQTSLVLKVLYSYLQTRKVIQCGLHPEVELYYRPNSPINGSTLFTIAASVVDWPAFHGTVQVKVNKMKI